MRESKLPFRSKKVLSWFHPDHVIFLYLECGHCQKADYILDCQRLARGILQPHSSPHQSTAALPGLLGAAAAGFDHCQRSLSCNGETRRVVVGTFPPNKAHLHGALSADFEATGDPGSLCKLGTLNPTATHAFSSFVKRHGPLWRRPEP